MNFAGLALAGAYGLAQALLLVLVVLAVAYALHRALTPAAPKRRLGGGDAARRPGGRS